jgi:CRISPR-associated protein Csb2
MPRVLVITVRFHEGRCHGWPEWPPSPARLFQALLAGVARGDAVEARHRETLRYLELLDPPVIAAPLVRKGQLVASYMPNNDLDAVLPGKLKAGGTLAAAVADIRAAKAIRPHLFDARTPLHFIYGLTDDAPDEADFADLAQGLYQLGRGIDMAWAAARIVDEGQAGRLLAGYEGVVHRPSGGADRLPVPADGTLASLEVRHGAFRGRLRRESGGVIFAQPPKALVQQVGYDAPAHLLVFDLDGAALDPSRAAAFTVALRDAAAQRLSAIPGTDAAVVARVVIGRGAGEADKAARLAILPLPSIGHVHADRRIRRVLVNVPALCPLPPDHLRWAFSGLDLATFGVVLAAADDTAMLRHYGSGEAAEPARAWRSVTPLVLTPRIPALRPNGHGKPASTRLDEEAAARFAVAQALRQAGMATKAQAIRVQREPFGSKDRPAADFAHGERFGRERLWHVELRLDRAVRGPLVLGDGRYGGLGLMAPHQPAEPGADGMLGFRIIGGLMTGADPRDVADAMRRAMMARVREALGVKDGQGLPAYFSGHEADGAKAADGSHRHLAIACDGGRIVVIAPHRLMHRGETGQERQHRRALMQALRELTDLRAGHAGRLVLESVDLAAADALLAPSRHWRTVTPYAALRHGKRMRASDVLAQDIATELHGLGLPEATIRVLSTVAGPGGLSGHAELSFAAAVPGPILIGRTRHRGGGLFAAVGESHPP